MIDLTKEFDINKLNTFTKYPSILTYHDIGERKTLRKTITENKDFNNQTLYITEKIDGVNARIVFHKGDYLIGSRDYFIHAKGDRIINEAHSIVPALESVAASLNETIRCSALNDHIVVVYAEVYGGKNITAASRNYTTNAEISYRVFDVTINKPKNVEEIMAWEIEKIAGWRERDNQRFLSANYFDNFICSNNLNVVPSFKSDTCLPTSLTLKDTYEWMKDFKLSMATLTNSADPDKMPLSVSEGIVVRTWDRSLIRKLRFEDYERTERLGLF